MERNLRKQREGVVTSNKMNKTITIEVLRRVKHPIYGKYVKKSSKITPAARPSKPAFIIVFKSNHNKFISHTDGTFP